MSRHRRRWGGRIAKALLAITLTPLAVTSWYVLYAATTVASDVPPARWLLILAFVALSTAAPLSVFLPATDRE